MDDEGIPVRFVRSIFVPEDETCFCLYEAASVDAIREAARRAALPIKGVLETVDTSKVDEMNAAAAGREEERTK
jgi:hypothetical protein